MHIDIQERMESRHSSTELAVLALGTPYLFGFGPSASQHSSILAPRQSKAMPQDAKRWSLLQFSMV